MKERGILMSAPMVRAYLAGLKTQTRRTRGLDEVNQEPDMWGLASLTHDHVSFQHKILDGQFKTCKLPYGTIGDSLWFKETFQVLYPQTVSWGGGEDDWDWDAEEWDGRLPEEPQLNFSYVYRASDPDGARWWRTSMFMPKYASRIEVPITNVRIERLKDISTADISAEGVRQTEDGFWLAPLAGVPDYPWGRADLAYAALWNSINGEKMPWDKDPWVWVYEFANARTQS